MASNELLSFLHISDLHFGDPPANAAPPPSHWRLLPLCDGWLAHDLRAITHLNDFAVGRPDLLEHMVITGDMTAFGGVTEFGTATQFISASITVDHVPLGLRQPAVLTRSIPGNHDHWPGSNRVVGPRNKDAFDAMFPALPFTPYTIALKNNNRLVVAGIDSDYDVGDWGTTRLLARGKFISQLEALQKHLGAAGPDEIRVLLVHHSPSWSGVKLAIDDVSTEALWEFVRQYGFAVLLTGHIHIPIGRITTVSHRGKTWNVLEARCGTTTQTDEMPLSWAGKGTVDPFRFPRNSLLVHRLVDHGQRIEWEVDIYWRRESGFDKKESLTRAVTVWPR